GGGLDQEPAALREPDEWCVHRNGRRLRGQRQKRDGRVLGAGVRHAALMAAFTGIPYYCLKCATTGPLRRARDFTFGRITGIQRPMSESFFHSAVSCRFCSVMK